MADSMKERHDHDSEMFHEAEKLEREREPGKEVKKNGGELGTGS